MTKEQTPISENFLRHRKKVLLNVMAFFTSKVCTYCVFSLLDFQNHLVPLWIFAFYYVYQIETAAKFEMEIEGRGQIYSGSCQCH